MVAGTSGGPDVAAGPSGLNGTDGISVGDIGAGSHGREQVGGGLVAFVAGGPTPRFVLSTSTIFESSVEGILSVMSSSGQQPPFLL